MRADAEWRLATHSLALDRAAVTRLVVSLVADELAQQRQQTIGPNIQATWSSSYPLAEQGLDLDSLERLAIASRLNQFFHIFETGLEDYLLAARTIGELVDMVVESQKDYCRDYTVLTSGSTGAPKPVRHSALSLLQEVREVAKLTSGCRRVVSMVPCHHIYGFLMTVWLPIVLGVPVIDGRSLPGSVRRSLDQGDLIVAVPSVWQYLATSLKGLDGLTGMSAAAPCPRETAKTLKACVLQDFIEIFGSSETGGIGWRRDSDQPFELFSYWHRPSCDGTRGEEGGATTLGRDLAGETVFYTPGDRLDYVDERRFHPRGRLDEAVQIGGHNVFPADVARRIKEHPGVRDCLVRLDGTDILKAYVVPVDGDAGDGFADELRSFLKARLKSHEIPRRLTIGAALPRNALGKPGDWTAEPSSVDPQVLD